MTGPFSVETNNTLIFFLQLKLRELWLHLKNIFGSVMQPACKAQQAVHLLDVIESVRLVVDWF